MSNNVPSWLRWSRELIAIGQTGIEFAQNPYDAERYVSVRRIGAEMLACASHEASVEQVLVALDGDIGYATPKIDVRAAVIREHKILLVRDVGDRCWTMPGGWADVGDAPSIAAVREVHEESGFDVHVRKLIAVLDRDKHGHPPIKHHAYKLFFLCDLVGGTATTSVETDAVDFFARDEIPSLSRSRVLPWQIDLAFEHSRNPELPTVFD
jgi:ADP-ribose pyrophosphatase YjhB (NUDIX family)